MATRMAAELHSDTAPFTSFLAGHIGPAHDLRLVRRPLRGGLVSASVQHVFVRYADSAGKNKRTSFVVKRLDGSATREAMVYDHLLPHTRGLAPDLFAVERATDKTLLFLEPVASRPRWPWRDVALAARVLEKLAALHEMHHAPGSLDDWNYGDELELGAQSTLQDAVAFVSATGDAPSRAGLPALRRLAANIREIRSKLLDFEALPRTIIHGDVHPGNVVIRTRGTTNEPLLLDWARARVGSPLEDVNAWIEWLGFWEHSVRRKHDTLLRGYFRARGIQTPTTSLLRDAYWLAGAVNCCSGALSYHLSVASDPTVAARQRATSLRAVHHCFRMIRRADWGMRRRSAPSSQPD